MDPAVKGIISVLAKFLYEIANELKKLLFQPLPIKTVQQSQEGGSL